MGVPHPDGGTPAVRPAAAEGNGGTRALAGHVGGQPRPAPVPDCQTRAATQLADDAATPPAPAAQPQPEEPTVDATEEAGGPLQQKESPLPAADLPAWGPPRVEIPTGMASQPKNQHASMPANCPPDMAACGSGEAPDACQPGRGPGGPTPDAEHAAGLPPPTTHGAQTAGHAGAAPSTAPAHRSDTGAPGDAATGEAPTRGPPRAHAESEARTTTPEMPKRAADRGTLPVEHTRDEDSLDAFMESCRSAPHTDPTTAALRGHPEPRDDHTEGTPSSHSSRCPARHTSSAITPPWGQELNTRPPRITGKRPQAGQQTRPRTNRAGTAPKGSERVWRQVPAPLASLPTSHLGPTHPGGGGIWTMRARKATPVAPAPTRNRGRPKTWTYGSTGSPQGSGPPWRSASDGCFFLQSCHLEEETSTMADIAFGHWAEPHAPPTTMDHPGKLHYVATRLMAHMGTYIPDEMNRLHWLWHRRAALRIHTAMQRHNIWAIPGSPGYQGHASGHPRPRSQEVPEPPRQTARQNSPGRHQGTPPGVGSGTYRSSIRPFTPRRDRGSPHSPAVQGGAQNGTRRQRTLAGPGTAAAHRLPQHNESSSTRVWTEAMEALTTRRSNRHHLPLIPSTGPRGPAPSGCTSPPFPRRPSEHDRQRSTQAPTTQQTVRPAHPPPRCQGRRPAH